MANDFLQQRFPDIFDPRFSNPNITIPAAAAPAPAPLISTPTPAAPLAADFSENVMQQINFLKSVRQPFFEQYNEKLELLTDDYEKSVRDMKIDPNLVQELIKANYDALSTGTGIDKENKVNAFLSLAKFGLGIMAQPGGQSFLQAIAKPGINFAQDLQALNAKSQEEKKALNRIAVSQAYATAQGRLEDAKAMERIKYQTKANLVADDYTRAMKLIDNMFDNSRDFELRTVGNNIIAVNKNKPSDTMLVGVYDEGEVGDLFFTNGTKVDATKKDVLEGDKSVTKYFVNEFKDGRNFLVPLSESSSYAGLEIDQFNPRDKAVATEPSVRKNIEANNKYIKTINSVANTTKDIIDNTKGARVSLEPVLKLGEKIRTIANDTVSLYAEIFPTEDGKNFKIGEENVGYDTFRNRITKRITEDAALKSVLRDSAFLDLAIILARVETDDARLSDFDVLSQLKSLGSESTNPNIIIETVLTKSDRAMNSLYNSYILNEQQRLQSINPDISREDSIAQAQENFKNNLLNNKSVTSLYNLDAIINQADNIYTEKYSGNPLIEKRDVRFTNVNQELQKLGASLNKVGAQITIDTLDMQPAQKTALQQILQNYGIDISSDIIQINDEQLDQIADALQL
jgi:hypothetical protein